MSKLHIGCGKNLLPDFINIDIANLFPKSVKSFIQLPAYPLTYFTSDAFEVVYACHVLEHMKEDKLTVLKEWVRVLKPEGRIRISVPDFDAAIKIYKKTNSLDCVNGLVTGLESTDAEFEQHRKLFNYESLGTLMQDAGLISIHTFNPFRQTNRDFFDYSMATTADIPISLNLEGVKPCE